MTKAQHLEAARAAPLEALRRWQNDDGGFGYRAGGRSVLEPTGLAVLALRTEPDRGGTVARALPFVRRCRAPGGGFGVFPGDDGGSWMAAYAALALGAGGEREEAVAACRALLALEDGYARPVPADVRERCAAVLHFDLAKRGWPWNAGTAAFVEPTATAMLALAALGFARTPGRVAEGVDFLRDRACAGGGWNYGNPAVFDTPLDPLPAPTALALLALARAGVPAEDPARGAGLRRLLSLLPGLVTATARAWTLLALAEAAPPSPEADAACAAVAGGLPQGAEGWRAGGRPLDAALAALALHRLRGGDPLVP